MDTTEGYILLPNGCALYWKPNGAGGRIYYSDEVGGGAFVWDTCLIDLHTLLAAIVQEQTLYMKELHKDMYTENSDETN